MKYPSMAVLDLYSTAFSIGKRPRHAGAPVEKKTFKQGGSRPCRKKLCLSRRPIPAKPDDDCTDVWAGVQRLAEGP